MTLDTLPPGERPATSRPGRYCEQCRLVDDHPRHIHASEDGRITCMHMDCCHNAGCPTGECTTVLRESDGAKGEDLVRFLEARMPGGR